MINTLAAPPWEQVRAIIRRALEEDRPWGDITSDSLIPPEVLATGYMVVKEDGIVSGIDVAAAVFAEVDPSLCWVPRCRDGGQVSDGTVISEVHGSARSILTAERTALNLMQRMSGIATATGQYVRAVAGTGATIVDTRKTAPGLRILDKYAVRCGGGSNHRFSLSDGVMVKDNHLAALGEYEAGARLVAALQAVRHVAPHTVKLEVEVDRLEQIDAALAGGADIILLDNMQPSELRTAVKYIGGRAITEASGGITMGSVRAVAESGVNLISIGALTHSVRALDIGLDLTVAEREDSGFAHQAASARS